MDEKKKNSLIVVLLVIIAVLTIFVVIISKTKNTTNNNNNGNTQTGQQENQPHQNNQDSLNNKEITYQKITQTELEKIIDEELYILNGKTSITEITNQKKLSLALRVLNSDRNDFNSAETFTKEDLENAFNKTSISKLGLIHENIIPVKSDAQDGNLGVGYTYSDGIYSNKVSTNSGLTSTPIIGKRVIAFNEDAGKYTITINYLWGQARENLMDARKVYGKNHGELGEIPIEVLTMDGNTNENIKVWFDQNYETFKDKLDTYNYVFTKENDKISLVDFYVSQ